MVLEVYCNQYVWEEMNMGFNIKTVFDLRTETDTDVVCVEDVEAKEKEPNAENKFIL